MTRDIAAIEADIDFAREQMKPWGDILTDLHREIDAAREEMAAAETISDMDLARLSAHTMKAADRLAKVAGEMHPAMRMLTHWLPIADDYSTGYFVAPHLLLEYKPGEEYVQSLADALIEFAARFVGPLPEGATHGDLVFADILDHDCGETQRYMLLFEPVAGGKASLVSHHFGRSTTEGTLVEMLTKACEVAWYSGGPQRSSDWDDERY